MQALSLALLFFTCALGVVAACTRWSIWRHGQPGVAPSIKALLQIPRRYLVDVHAVVARDKLSARMHVGAAGGTLANTLLTLTILIDLIHGWVAASCVVVFALGGVVGASMDVYRRRRPTVEMMSDGEYRALPWLLIGANLFLLCVGGLASLNRLPPLLSLEGIALLALGASSLLPLGWMAGSGPMRHAIVGALHLAWHHRQDRFTKGSSTGLLPLQLQAPQLGVAQASDLRWNQLLGFDACVQCGRCEAACPAFAAGLPLNPKRLINDIAQSHSSVRYYGKPHPGKDTRAPAKDPLVLIGATAAIDSDTLWACTTCRACVDACPMMIEHVDAVVDMRRYQTLEIASTPGKAPELLAALAETDTCSGRSLNERLNFASDLKLPRLVPGEPVDILVWLGESAFNTRNQRSLRALFKVLKNTSLSFGVLELELDCGDTARRLGDEVEFQRLVRQNIERLSAYTFDRIVTLDPHVAHCLAVEYPDFGGRYDVHHHTALLSQLMTEGAIELRPRADLKVTYHDPCYLSRYLGETEAPRNIIARTGTQFVEMSRHGRQSFCCGGGGGAPITDIAGKRRIPDIRMEQAAQTQADIVLVACPNCTNMLEGVPGNGPKVMEISEYLLENLA